MFDHIKRRRVEAAFRDGYWGEDFAAFKRLGPKMVRHLYETNKLTSQREYNAAEIWLAPFDRREAIRAAITAYLPHGIAALMLTATVVGILLRLK